MKLYLICDNSDIAVGMRLAGIESTVAANESEASAALEKAVKDENIALILMNKALFDSCECIIKDFRKTHSVPVIIDIPDRDSRGSGDSLAKYIREAVGISI